MEAPSPCIILGTFLARDSIQRYTLSALCYRPSVCLSVTLVDHTKTVKDSIMKFSPYGSPIPLVIVGYR